MERYAKYKDSGIAWLGEIPEHWEVIKLKYIGESIIGMTYSPDDVVPSKGTLVLRSSNIQDGKLSLDDCIFIQKDIPDKLRVRKGDILICSRNGSRSLIGKNITIDETTEGQTFGAFMTVFRTKLSEFVSKYFNSQVFNGQSGLFLTATINQLTINTINNFFIALPSLEEQKAIAAYLNHKTAEIDELIAQKERLIELYEEEKTAIINEAVTKGINPDVKLKPTAINWLGDIPEHWSYCSLGYLSSLTSGGTPDRSNSEYWNGDIPWLKTGEINYNIITSSEEFISQKGLENSSAKKALPGTILMAMYGQGNTRGRVAILGIEASFNQATLAITPKKKLHINFLYCYLISVYKFIRDIGNETSQMNLSSGSIGKIPITYPPLKEQKVIAEYIEKETARIDAKIAKNKRIIELQKEYRTALISEAVTGKIKVPN
jgi:type I restriction enzyme S subunit